MRKSQTRVHAASDQFTFTFWMGFFKFSCFISSLKFFVVFLYHSLNHHSFRTDMSICKSAVGVFIDNFSFIICSRPSYFSVIKWQRFYRSIESNVKLIFRSHVINYRGFITYIKNIISWIKPTQMEIMDGKCVCCLNVLHSPSTTINNTHFSGIPLNENRFTLNSKSIDKFFSTKRNDGSVY